MAKINHKENIGKQERSTLQMMKPNTNLDFSKIINYRYKDPDLSEKP